MCLQLKHSFVVLVLHVSFDLYTSLMQRMRPWTINNVLRFTNWETRDSGKIEADSEIMTCRRTVASVLIYSLQKMKSCDIWLTVFHPSSKLSLWSERETKKKSLRVREREWQKEQLPISTSLITSLESWITECWNMWGIVLTSLHMHLR